MITRLVGRVAEVEADRAVIDVGGVGYLVHCSRHTLGALPAAGEITTLSIEMQVRPDAIVLFGFADTLERDWFRLMITVQGVGSRLALAVLSVLGPDALRHAILAADKAALARAEGVGPRLASRITSELKERAAGMGVMSGNAGSTRAAPGLAPALASPVEEDALSALVNLGYGRSEAHAAIAGVVAELGAEATVETLIPAALKALGR